MMDGSVVCPVTATVAAIGVTCAAWVASRSTKKPDGIQFGAVTALIFAGQMMNFPIMQGTSGHLLGGVLASVLLGTPFGILSIALILVVQCLLFSDGGISVLGANILNMALIGAGVEGVIANSLRKWKSQVGIAFAALFSVLLAALACSIELAVAGTASFGIIAPAMLATHALIGCGEIFITLTLLNFMPSCQCATYRRRISIPLAASFLVALILSPFASSYPDGLEWLAEKYSLLHTSAPAFVAPLANYTVPGITQGALATGMAGAIGVLVVFGMGCLLALAWHQHQLK